MNGPAFEPGYFVTNVGLVKRKAQANKYTGRADARQGMWRVHLMDGFYVDYTYDFYYPSEAQAARFTPGQVLSVPDLFKTAEVANEEFVAGETTRGYTVKVLNRYTGMPERKQFWTVPLVGQYGTLELIDLTFPTEWEAARFTPGVPFKFQDIFAIIPAPLVNIIDAMRRIMAARGNMPPPRPPREPRPRRLVPPKPIAPPSPDRELQQTAPPDVNKPPADYVYADIEDACAILEATAQDAVATEAAAFAQAQQAFKDAQSEITSARQAAVDAWAPFHSDALKKSIDEGRKDWNEISYTQEIADAAFLPAPPAGDVPPSSPNVASVPGCQEPNASMTDAQIQSRIQAIEAQTASIEAALTAYEEGITAYEANLQSAASGAQTYYDNALTSAENNINNILNQQAALAAQDIQNFSNSYQPPGWQYAPAYPRWYWLTAQYRRAIVYDQGIGRWVTVFDGYGGSAQYNGVSVGLGGLQAPENSAGGIWWFGVIGPWGSPPALYQ